MITIPPVAAAPAICRRINVAFSTNGRYGTCVRVSEDDRTLESWTLGPPQARGWAVPDLLVDGGTRTLALDDGRIIVFQTFPPHERHELTLVYPTDRGPGVHRLGAIRAPAGGYLLPSPSGAHLGFVVAPDCGHSTIRPKSTIWRLSATPPHAELVAQVPGVLDGGVWLDSDAQVLAVNQTCGSDRPNGIAVDLTQGSWKTIWSRSEASADRILLGSLRSGILIVSTTVSGGHRLGWATLGDPTVHFPEILHRPGYPREALALDDRGARLLVHEVAGALSRLFVYTIAAGELAPLAAAPGTISAPASWVGNRIRCGFSAPTQPATIATVEVGAVPRWSACRDQDGAGQTGTAPAELIELEGPTGPVEAIVYGGPAWRAREHLVVALHGGPLSSWRFGFEPLFHCLSAAGVAVVAPNYHGSTGYGERHLRAVIGNWGGPDLDDVLAVGHDLEQHRALRQLPRPVVLGVSYGAFLALLAACHAPQLWSACVALAPFLSGPRFYDSAPFAVQRRIARLGGLRRIDDALGPRDVLRSCAALSAPLLLMHGVEDETIPLTQSRMLRQRLLELGHTEGVDFEYVEADSDHGGLIQRTPLTQRVAQFCLARSALDRNRQLSIAGSHRKSLFPQ